MTDITMDDVIREIQRLNAENPEGWTIADMCASTGWYEDKCRIHVKQLIRANRARCNGKARRIAIDGAMRPVPVYVLIKA